MNASDVSVVRRADSTLWRRTADGVVLLGPDGILCALSVTGAHVWTEVGDGCSLAALVSDAVAAFGAEPAQARLDIEAMLRDLAARGHLTVGPP